jgi:hypothetical protein
VGSLAPITEHKGKPEIQTKITKTNQKVGNRNNKTVFVWIVDLKLSNLGNPNKKVGIPNKNKKCRKSK